MRTIISICAVALLSACGGGNTADPPVVSTLVTSSASTADTIALGPVALAAPLPNAAGIEGTIVFPAVGTPATLDLSASATAPPGVALQNRRRTSSDFSIDIYEYITLAPKSTVLLPVLPALTMLFPATIALNGKSLFFGITDPAAQPGALAAFETEGPAKVVGRRATIGALARPLVLQAGHRYTFIVYATSVPAGVTSPTLYVPDRESGSVATYHADGTDDLAPITNGLSAPLAVGVSPSGTIYILDPQRSVVATYAGNGTREPLTIALPTAPHDGGVQFFGVDIDPDGTIDIPTTGVCHLGCGLGSILRFAPDGSTLPAIDMTPSVGVIAAAVDTSGNIDVIGDPGTAVTRYSRDGTSNRQVVTGLRNATAIAVDTAGRLYLVADQTIVSYNADGSSRPLAIAPNFVPGPIAVDAAGKIYVVDAADRQIVSYNADGSPAAPTITTGNGPAGITVH